MSEKGRNVFKKAINFLFGKKGTTGKLEDHSQNKAKAVRENIGSTAKSKRVEDVKRSGGGMYAISPKTFGEAIQRSRGHGTRPDKKVNRLHVSRKTKARHKRLRKAS